MSALGSCRHQTVNVIDPSPDRLIHNKKKESEEKHGSNDDESRSGYFTPVWPGDVVQFFSGFPEKIPDAYQLPFKLYKKIFHGNSVPGSAFRVHSRF
jgi:signal peptidase I